MVVYSFLFAGCTDNELVGHQYNRYAEKYTNADTAFTYSVYSSDSIKIDVKNHDFKFTVMLSIGDFRQQYDLQKLHIPATTPDDIIWINGEYACMMTYWSQDQSRYIFIPARRENRLIYIDRDIRKTDSLHNNVVYVDSVYTDSGKVALVIENLVTRNTKSMVLRIDCKDDIYPYYDTISLTGNRLTIRTSKEEKSIDISGIGYVGSK